LGLWGGGGRDVNQWEKYCVTHKKYNFTAEIFQKLLFSTLILKIDSAYGIDMQVVSGKSRQPTI